MTVVDVNCLRFNVFSCCNLIKNYDKNSEFILYVAFSHVYFQRQKFSFQTKSQRQKMESIYGAGFWSVCHGY